MPAQFTDLDSKAERAVAAWLIAQGCGTPLSITPAEHRTDNTYPLANITCGIAQEETPFSGRYSIPIFVTIKGSAAFKSVNEKKSKARIEYDAFVAKIADNLLLTDNQQDYQATAEAITAAGQELAVLNPDDDADMADFTCEVWQRPGFGKGEPDEKGAAWIRVLTFEGVFCASAIS